MGQDEVEICKVADTPVVALTPQNSDEIQALKAGIMKIADLVVINKTDLDPGGKIEKHYSTLKENNLLTSK